MADWSTRRPLAAIECRTTRTPRSWAAEWSLPWCQRWSSSRRSTATIPSRSSGRSITCRGSLGGRTAFAGPCFWRPAPTSSRSRFGSPPAESCCAGGAATGRGRRSCGRPPWIVGPWSWSEGRMRPRPTPTGSRSSTTTCPAAGGGRGWRPATASPAATTSSSSTRAPASGSPRWAWIAFRRAGVGPGWTGSPGRSISPGSGWSRRWTTKWSRWTRRCRWRSMRASRGRRCGGSSGRAASSSSVSNACGSRRAAIRHRRPTRTMPGTA